MASDRKKRFHFLQVLKGQQIFADFLSLLSTLLATQKLTEFHANSSMKIIARVIKESTARGEVLEALLNFPEVASTMFSVLGLVLAELSVKVVFSGGSKAEIAFFKIAKMARFCCKSKKLLYSKNSYFQYNKSLNLTHKRFKLSLKTLFKKC